VPDAPEQIDGRTARRDRNRDAVLDAALDLFREDAMFPAPAEIAERSGVSTRSVQRYFPDMDTLVRAAMARHLEKVGPLFLLDDIGIGSFEERLYRIVAARVRLHEAIAPMVRAALVWARRNDLIRGRMVAAQALARDQVIAMFAPELDALDGTARADAIEALDVLLGFESVEHLREIGGLTPDVAGRVLRTAVGAVLAGAR
jgi:TetR/AcrR family transcriptional regulator of autoinduction and epiphytic fitness